MEMLEYIFEENLLPKSIFGKVSSYFFLLFLPIAKYGTTQVNANLIIFKERFKMFFFLL